MSFDRYDTLTSKSPWLFLLLVIVVWIGFVCTCEAAEEPKVDEVVETSPCNHSLEMWNGAQLVSLQIDPDSLAARAVFFKKLEDNKAMLFILLRAGCQEPWRAVKAIPLELKPQPKACVPDAHTQCL